MGLKTHKNKLQSITHQKVLDRKSAQKKIKSHIERCDEKQDINSDNFVITKPLVLYWFHLANKAFFNNKLPVPIFEFRRLRGTWGLCIFKNNEYVITLSLDITSKKLLISTLLHEIVHQQQYFTTGTMSHAESYLKWKRYFKKNFDIVL